MSFFKSKAFIISAASLCVLTVVGIGTGVGLSSRNNQTTSVNKPANIPVVNKIKALVEKINKDSFVFYELLEKNSIDENNDSHNKQINLSSTEIKKDESYAFDIVGEQIKLNKELEQDLKSFEYEINLDSTKNKAVDLNKGELTITIKITDTTDSTISENKDVTISDFKKSDAELIKVLDANDNSLTISVKDQSIDPEFVNLEFFNSQLQIGSGKVPTKPSEMNLMSLSTTLMASEDDEEDDETINLSGLSLWFNNSKEGEINNKEKNLFILGNVVLEDISKTSENKTLFHLKAQDETKGLRLVKKANNNIVHQALISEVKTTNVLATDLTVVPNLANTQESNTYLNKLKNDENTGYLKDNQNSYLNRDLSVNLNTDNRVNSANNLFIKPYLITKKLENNNNQLPFHIILSYGNGKGVKKYDTANGYDLQKLKAASFSFGFYGKKLNQTDALIKAMDLKNSGNMLNEYFKTQNYNKPVDQTTFNQVQQDSEPKKTKGEFYPTLYGNEMLKSGLVFDVSFGNKEDMENNLAKKQETENQNLLVFASYSFNGLMNNKILFTPSISLVHIATTKVSNAMSV